MLGGEQLQRIPGQQFRIAARTLARGDERRQAGLTHPVESVGGELDPTRRGVELARHRTAGRPPGYGARTQPVERSSSRSTVGSACAQQGVVVVEQGRVGVAHRGGEPAEQFGVRDATRRSASMAAPFHPTQR